MSKPLQTAMTAINSTLCVEDSFVGKDSLWPSILQTACLEAQPSVKTSAAGGGIGVNLILRGKGTKYCFIKCNMG